MATIYIDGKPYTVKDGQNLLHACLSLGFDLPYFCWHPALHSVGACRQCAVKQFEDEKDDKGDIVMACMTPAKDGTRISIDDPEAREFRAGVIEWLMVHHPHDCPVCDEGGECHLQDMTVMTGHNYRRYRFGKRTFRNQYLGPFINHEMNRCIQCYRCQRFYRFYAGGTDFDVFGVHDRLYFGRQQDGVLENEFSGNLVEICPTGVFTDKTFKAHYTRKWDLQTAPSICVHCGLGCNTLPGERYGELRRIRNRYHSKLNGYFLCDRGRFGYGFVNSERRMRQALLRSDDTADWQAATPDAVLRQAASWMAPGRTVIGIGSPRAGLEANFVLKALVGPENFYAGLSRTDRALHDGVLAVLQHGPARSTPWGEARDADAVLVLGEDLTNTAPMLSLTLRQLERPSGAARAAATQIPAWNATGRREVTQQEKAPLFMATPCATKLDDIAAVIHHATPDGLVRLALAIGHRLDERIPDVPDLAGTDGAVVRQIADALSGAKRPLVVCGTSCGSRALVEAAANIAWALQDRDRPAGIILTVPECNSLGLTMLRSAGALEDALERIRVDADAVALVLENDLFRHLPRTDVVEFLDRTRAVVIDHTASETGKRAQAVLPAATFAESSGTLVNNEGRAQRYFQVYTPTGDVRASWRWIRDLSVAAGRSEMQSWMRLDDVHPAMVAAVPALRGVEQAAPGAGFRALGDKIPRQSFRYSGRTAMHAHIDVHEPLPARDPDAPLSFSMEGYGGPAPPALIPRYWSPGWNSVQALNKYQQEVAGALQGEESGRRLLEPAPRRERVYYTGGPEPVRPAEGRWRAVRLYEIFGSEELSLLAAAVAERVPRAHVVLGPDDAAALEVAEGDRVRVALDDTVVQLPVRLRSGLPAGTAGLPCGLPGMPVWDGDTRIQVFKDRSHE